MTTLTTSNPRSQHRSALCGTKGGTQGQQGTNGTALRARLISFVRPGREENSCRVFMTLFQSEKRVFHGGRAPGQAGAGTRCILRKTIGKRVVWGGQKDQGVCVCNFCPSLAPTRRLPSAQRAAAKRPRGGSRT